MNNTPEDKKKPIKVTVKKPVKSATPPQNGKPDPKPQNEAPKVKVTVKKPAVKVTVKNPNGTSPEVTVKKPNGNSPEVTVKKPNGTSPKVTVKKPSSVATGTKAAKPAYNPNGPRPATATTAPYARGCSPALRRSNTVRTSHNSLDAKKARSGWLFMLPFLIGLFLIYVPVIVDSITYSFATVKTLQGGGFKLIMVGFENYNNALFVDTNFTQILVSGIKDLLFDIPAIVIFSLFMAVLLNQKMLGRAVFRAIFFIPVILCTGLIDEIDMTNSLSKYMADTTSSIDNGSGNDAVNAVVSLTDIQWMFSSMKVGTELTTYVVDIMNNIYDIINRSGVQMLIFLAGLQSISPAIYESCEIDGASAWESFWKITIPMVSPMILVNAIYTVIDALTASSNSVMSYISTIYNSSGGHELSSAMSWIYFLIVIAIIGLVAAILSVFIFYQRRD